MSSMINILFIDDSCDDAELAVLKLRRAGIAVEYRRVATFTAMENAIRDEKWDVILCDCKLPGFTALNVWMKLRELDTNVPFLVFTDLVLNTEVQKLLDAGVHSFVDKNQMENLAPALQKILRHSVPIRKQPLNRNKQ